MGETSADYSEAIRLDPKEGMAYNNRGFLYYRKGDYVRAMADYDEAIRVEPTLILPYVTRAALYEKLGDTAKAKADRDRVAALRKQQ